MPRIKAYTFQFPSHSEVCAKVSVSLFIVSQLFGFVLSITVFFYFLSLGYGFSHYFKTTIKVTKNFFYFILQLCTKDLARGSMKGLGDFPPKSLNHRT